MRDWLWPGVLALVCALLAALLVWATEWADMDIRIPPKGEAATNPLYAAQALARDLGADVARKTSLEAMPPAGATLVLSSRSWNLLPGREQALRAWVEQGGHLVIPRSGLDDKIDWLPVHEVDRGKSSTCPKPGDDTKKGGDDDDDDEENDTKEQTNAVRKAGAKKLTCGPWENNVEEDNFFSFTPYGTCHYLSQTGAADEPGFRVCTGYWSSQSLDAKPGVASTWSIQDQEGHAVLRRVALGQGSVTVIGIWDAITGEDVLDADHAQLWAAALQLHPGMALWFVAEERRATLLLWLWQQAWTALLLALLALAAWLWRSAPRFGPRQATPRLERRSMAEQIVGTAHFLARNDAQALHQAQLRALDEAAAPRLRRWALLEANARARQLARLTGLPLDAITSALAEGPRLAAPLEADLCCLETAVRRLRRLTSQVTALPDEPGSSS